MGPLWEFALASGCESEGSGFEPWQLQITFDSRLPKNNKWFQAKNSVPLMNKKFPLQRFKNNLSSLLNALQFSKFSSNFHQFRLEMLYKIKQNVMNVAFVHSCKKITHPLLQHQNPIFESREILNSDCSIIPTLVPWDILTARNTCHPIHEGELKKNLRSRESMLCIKRFKLNKF